MAGEGIADGAFLDILEAGGDVAHLPGAQGVDGGWLRGENAHFHNFDRLAGGHHAQAFLAGDAAVGQADVGDDALVGVVGGIEHQGAEGGVVEAVGGRHAGHDGVQEFGAAGAGFGGDIDYFVAAESENLRHFRGDAFRFGGGQVNLVDYGDDFQVVFHSQQGVGDGLGFHALGGVHYQQGAFAGGQGAGDFVGKVHMAGGVDEVELVIAGVGAGAGDPVGHRHGLALDGDAAFPFQFHLVQELGFHILGAHGAGDFQDAVGKGGFAVINVGDDAEVADALLFHSECLPSSSAGPWRSGAWSVTVEPVQNRATTPALPPDPSQRAGPPNPRRTRLPESACR